MKYEEVYAFMINKLESGLPAYITYHDVNHTKFVIQSSEMVAKAENITGDDLLLIKTAALFHDSGFLQSHQDHEMLGCRLAQKYLPEYNYTEAQIDSICRMIMSTKLPQSATEKFSQILCDADLYYLGNEDYAVYAEKLFLEFRRYNLLHTKEEWKIKQAEFLSSHRYFTESAKESQSNQKEENLQKIKEEILKDNHVERKKSMKDFLQDVVLILLGVIIAGVALKGFLMPNKFFDGGVTGMSLLLYKMYGINIALAIFLLNLPLTIWSYFTISKKFAKSTLISVSLLGICLLLLPNFAITSDKLLIAIFGGAFLGLGVGLVMRAGASLDSMEVLALHTLKRTSFTIAEIILGINILIFTIAAFAFGIESALYSILTYFAATRTIDYVVEGFQAYLGVSIISAKSEVIKYQLVNHLGRGITIYKGERGYLPGSFEVSADCEIIFTVISRLEFRKLKNLVYEIDPKAFVFASNVREASGGILSLRKKH